MSSFFRDARRIVTSIGSTLAYCMVSLGDDRTARALIAAYYERVRQDGRWGAGDFPSGGLGFGTPEAIAEMERLKAACDRAMKEKRCTFADVLLEEVAELLAAKTREEALTEARQCVAVLIKLAEYLDHNTLQSRATRVYIAMPFGMAHEAARLSREMEADGFEITSEWPTWALTKTDPPPAEALLRNRAAIRRADLVLVWNANDKGRETIGEAATALTFGKRVLWATTRRTKEYPLGQGASLSICHPSVTRFEVTSLVDIVDFERAALIQKAHEIAMWMRQHQQ